MLLQKVQTAARLAMKPSAYPMLWRLTKSRLTGRPLSLEDTGPDAAKWCQAHAASDADIVEKLFHTRQMDSLATTYPAEYQQAMRAVADCGQAMGGGAHIDLIYTIMRRAKSRSAVETGVAYGWSSLAMLLAVQVNGGGHVASSNLNYRGASDESVGCAVPETLRQSWTLVPRADAEALPEIFSRLPEYDFCHYDSDKSYAGRMRTYPLLWERLKTGGFFVSDDVGDNLAFAHFCRQLGARPHLASVPASQGEKYVGIIVKAGSLQYRPIQF